MGRYHGMTADERHCRICGKEEVENECDFLFEGGKLEEGMIESFPISACEYVYSGMRNSKGS